MKSANNHQEQTTALAPMDYIQNALQHWWVIVLGMCLGGLLGAGLHNLIPPVYQAQAVISAGIDYAKTGKLTDVEEDYMIKKVGDLIGSDAVIENTLERAAEQGIELDRPAFDEMRFMQRSFNDWLLIVRSEDPGRAAEISNLWADSAWSALEDASVHLIKLEACQMYLETQTACRDLQLTTGVGTVCYLGSAEDIDTQINETLATMETERLAAAGLIDGVVFNLTSHAVAPTRPQILDRASLALAGAILGGMLTCVYLFMNRSTPRRTKSPS